MCFKPVAVSRGRGRQRQRSTSQDTDLAPAEEAGGSRGGDGREMAELLGEMQGDVWMWMLVTVKTTVEVSQGRSD